MKTVNETLERVKVVGEYVLPDGRRLQAKSGVTLGKSQTVFFFNYLGKRYKIEESEILKTGCEV